MQLEITQQRKVRAFNSRKNIMWCYVMLYDINAALVDEFFAFLDAMLYHLEQDYSLQQTLPPALRDKIITGTWVLHVVIVIILSARIWRFINKFHRFFVHYTQAQIATKKSWSEWRAQLAASWDQRGKFAHVVLWHVQNEQYVSHGP